MVLWSAFIEERKVRASSGSTVFRGHGVSQCSSNCLILMIWVSTLTKDMMASTMLLAHGITESSSNGLVLMVHSIWVSSQLVVSSSVFLTHGITESTSNWSILMVNRGRCLRLGLGSWLSLERLPELRVMRMVRLG